MSGDYSRHRFDPLNDFSGVLMQQGRVQLDADWNELVDLIERRFRAGTLDTIGLATVPRQTPDGFKITVVGGIPLIGPGRIYVDGLLAENHGTGARVFDPTLAELHGSDPIPFDQQPYFPNLNTVAPFPGEGGPHLVYLDVWKREVTFLEDPDLVEIAVGVDTTTRFQTVWQVRTLANIGDGATCDSPDNALNGWADIIRPSAGRLSTAATGVAEDDDPCLLPPSGGYKGLENRLYRVEIHDKGPEGTATFKWSRDNASIATAVLAIPILTTLVVARIGRDSVLRFSAGDWIEITDDWREFAGLPGIMRRIKDVDDATRTITLHAPLAAGDFDTGAEGATDPARHTRIRRWDHKGQVFDVDDVLLADLDAAATTGVIPVPAGGASVVLEDGVEITFSTDPHGGDLQIGDFWTFAARTADASVERLDAAAPQGVHHHFCRLAVVNLPNDIDDCRILWPPESGDGGCDCTVCLSPEAGGEGIQQAIDEHKGSGATICLGPGLFNLRRPLRVSAARALRIKGHGWKTQLVYLGPGPAILVENAIDVTFEELGMLFSGGRDANGSAIAARNCLGLTIQRCVLLQLGLRGVLGRRDILVRGERPQATAPLLPAIGMLGIMAEVFIRENVIVATIGIGTITTSDDDPVRGRFLATARTGIRPLLAHDLLIRDNLLIGEGAGVYLEGRTIHAGRTSIASNTVRDAVRAGIVASGTVMANGGIDISGNHLQVRGDAIEASGEGTLISGNVVDAPIRAAGNGIVISESTRDGRGSCTVVGNRISGTGGHGILAGFSARASRVILVGERQFVIRRLNLGALMIKQNHIENCGGGIFMADEASAAIVDIEDNHLLRIAPDEDRENRELSAIRVVRGRNAGVVGNTVKGVGASSVQSANRTGIQVIGPSDSVRITGNDVSDVGPHDAFVNQATGIECWGPMTHLNIIGNRAQLGTRAAQGLDQTFRHSLRVGGATKGAVQPSPTVAFLTTEKGPIYSFLGNYLILHVREPGGLSIQNNLFDCYGLAETVIAISPDPCILSGNHCRLFPPLRLPAVLIHAATIIASSNSVDAGNSDIPAMVLHSQQNQRPGFTVLGNISGGRILVNGADLADPWRPLNVLP